MPLGSRQTFLVHVHPDDQTAVVEDVRDGGCTRAAELSDVGPCISRLLGRRFVRPPAGADAFDPAEAEATDRPRGEPATAGDDSVRGLP